MKTGEKLFEKNKPLNESENAFHVFDDILVSANGKIKDQLFISGTHTISDKNYFYR